MQIVFCGDSFCADYRLADPSNLGWPLLLAKTLGSTVRAFGLAGASQYRIFKQVAALKDLNGHDLVIMCHTSPYRLFTNHHPLRQKDPLHFASDFVVSDTFAQKKYYAKDPYVQAAKYYYEYLLDEEHALDMHRLLCEKLQKMGEALSCRVLHASGFDYSAIYQFPHFVPIHDLVVSHPGSINHLDAQGNVMLVERFQSIISRT